MIDERSGETLPDNWEEVLSAVIRRGLERFDAPKECEVSLSFVTEREMREMNLGYRDVDGATDVLSFAFSESGGRGEAAGETAGGDAPPVMLGDIVICSSVARSQAETYGHSYMRELSFLTAHGLLHLLGFDHETEEGERAMISAQDGILNDCGVFR